MDSTSAASYCAPHAVQVEEFNIQGFISPIAVRLYRPTTVPQAEKKLLPAILYFHGGGFVGGSLDDANIPANYIAVHCPAIVLSVDYSLAPHRPFPSAPEDAHAAARWLMENANALQIAPQRIAVAGDDAGGNLAASVCLIARDRNGPPILAQILIGPMLDPSMINLGDAEHLQSDIQPKACAACYRQYLPTTQQRLHPYAAPLSSRRLRGLPPAFLATAKNDVLHREAEIYAGALIAAGVPTQITRFAVRHADLPRHLPMLAEATEFLRRRLHGERSTAI